MTASRTLAFDPIERAGELWNERIGHDGAMLWSGPPAPGAVAILSDDPPALRMILRNLERRPLRAAVTIGGIAAATAIVIMGNFFRDAIETIVDTQFNLAMRSDVIVWTNDPVDAAAGRELARLPGKQRQVMVAHYDGLSHEQIAELLGMGTDAVRQNLSRARKTLRKRYVMTHKDAS